jgi:ketosteroid isomerase-like protein
MDRDDVRNWVERYEAAWRSNDPDQIGALFAEDARYSTAPFREPWAGRDTIVRGWLDRKDEPGDWSFEHDVVAVDGDLGVVRGVTDYPNDDPSRYSNLWLIRLDGEGRATEFVEFWMGHE